MARVLFKCSECKQKIEAIKMIFWGRTYCYNCWEIGINKKKVKELREQLFQYMEPYMEPYYNRPKKDLSLSQLKEVKQIFEDNYFGEFDDRSKEIFNALVWRSKDEPTCGPLPLKITVDKIKEMMKLKERASGLRPEPVTLDCPFCSKKFSYELDKENSVERREAREELNEELNEHIREAHGEDDSEDNQKVEQTSSDASQPRTNSPDKANENKTPWPLIIGLGTTILLIAVGTIAFIFLKKKKNNFSIQTKKKQVRARLANGLWNK